MQNFAHKYQLLSCYICQYCYTSFEDLPLGMPQGPGVLTVSRKSRSYVRAGGNVSATWLVVLHTRQATTANINSHDLEFMMNTMTNLNYSQAHFVPPEKHNDKQINKNCKYVIKIKRKFTGLLINCQERWHIQMKGT